MLDFTILNKIRSQKPLIHCFSNLVTINDCANILLSIGASPIMAMALEEVSEITRLSAAVVLNLGTPDENKFDAIIKCGVTARNNSIPIILDPVGIGSSSWRLQKAQFSLKYFSPTILRVNFAEASALLGYSCREHGVDSFEAAEPNIIIRTAEELAVKYSSIVLLTGTEDIATNGNETYIISGGSALMTKITGAGCMLSSLCGAFAAVEPDYLSAITLASAFWKTCALISSEKSVLPGTFRVELFNNAYSISNKELEKLARISKIK